MSGKQQRVVKGRRSVASPEPLYDALMSEFGADREEEDYEESNDEDEDERLTLREGFEKSLLSSNDDYDDVTNDFTVPRILLLVGARRGDNPNCSPPVRLFPVRAEPSDECRGVRRDEDVIVDSGVDNPW